MIKFEFRHRPDPMESIGRRHAGLMATIDKLGEDWAIDLSDPLAPPDIGSELSAFISLPIANGAVSRASIEYVLRKESYLLDAAEFDDLLLIEMSVSRVASFDQMEAFFVRYASWFNSYRAQAVYSPTLQAHDWRNIGPLARSTRLDVDGRDSVYRFAPLNFFDREMCRRAFSRTPEDLAEIASERGVRFGRLDDGVLITAAAPETVSDARLIELDGHIKTVIGEPMIATG